MAGFKKGAYWKLLALHTAHYLADFIKVAASNAADYEAAEKVSYIAMQIRSLLRKDGEFELVKTESTDNLKRETIKKLGEAVRESEAFSVAKRGRSKLTIDSVLLDNSLTGNEKQYLMYRLLNPGVVFENTKDGEAIGKALGLSVSTIRRVDRKLHKRLLEI